MKYNNYPEWLTKYLYCDSKVKCQNIILPYRILSVEAPE